MNSTDSAPEDPKSIVGELMFTAWKKAKKRDLGPLERPLDENGKPMDEKKYEQVFRQDCDYLGKDILPASLLKSILTFLRRNSSDIKKYIYDGMTHGLGFFPTTDVGSSLTNDQIKKGFYLLPVHINKEGLTEDFCLLKGRFFDVMPQGMREACSMPVSYSDKKDPFPTDDEFRTIYNFYIDSFNAWRRFFGLKELDEKEVPRYTVKKSAA